MTASIPTKFLDEAAKLCVYYNFNVVPPDKKVDIAMLAVSLHRNVILMERLKDDTGGDHD